MAKESVQAVRQAEINAAQKEKDALQEKERIITEAGQNAKTLITSMTKQAMEKAELKKTAANQKGIELLEAARLKAENEVLLMREMAQRKEEAAIKLVLSSVIHGNT
jgi:V/A-type H+/Na+-transporting ATPase subunit G/H